MHKLIRLCDILQASHEIYPKLQTRLPTAIAYSNEASFNAAWASYLTAEPYHERDVRSDAILLGLLPSTTQLRAGNHFILSVGDSVVADSVAHALRDDHSALERALGENRHTVEIQEECLLLARYGHGTWGHWAAEILPIAAVIESMLPSKFHYAIPQSGTTEYVTGMLQSLAYYGIGIDRIHWLREGNDYILKRAWSTTPIWSDSAPHPHVLDVLRSREPRSISEGQKKIALLRRDWPTRTIANAVEVEKTLVAHGFHIMDIVGLNFAHQVEAFRSAETVFSVLGSGLSGLVYSPRNVRVIAASPNGWSDRFFYALVQRLDGQWADVKGKTLWNEKSGLLRDAPFQVPIGALKEAILALGV